MSLPGSIGLLSRAKNYSATSPIPPSAGGVVSSLKVTYTGTPQTPLILALSPGNVVVPVAAVAGQATYTAYSGPNIQGFIYTENNAPSGNRLLTLSLDDLVGVTSTFSPNSCAVLTSLQTNALVTIAGNYAPNTMPLLTTLEANSLVNCFTFAPTTMAALVVLRFDALVNVGGNFAPITMALVTTFSFAALKSVSGNVAPATMASLVTLSLPAIERIGANLAPTGMASCTTVSLAAMISYGGTITIPSATMANVASVTLGTIGTLKSIGGATITLSGLKIPSANVNAILALLVSLDGTGGTTLWGAGKTLTINGGTNGAPTGQGIIDAATLVTRGATVTTN